MHSFSSTLPYQGSQNKVDDMRVKLIQALTGSSFEPALSFSSNLFLELKLASMTFLTIYRCLSHPLLNLNLSGSHYITGFTINRPESVISFSPPENSIYYTYFCMWCSQCSTVRFLPASTRLILLLIFLSTFSHKSRPSSTNLFVALLTNLSEMRCSFQRFRQSPTIIVLT